MYLKKFVYIAVIFGVLLTILIPPFQSPDEDSHFKKAFVMAEGRFYPEVQKGQQGYWLSENMVEYVPIKSLHAEIMVENFLIKKSWSMSVMMRIIQIRSFISFPQWRHAQLDILFRQREL